MSLFQFKTAIIFVLQCCSFIVRTITRFLSVNRSHKMLTILPLIIWNQLGYVSKISHDQLNILYFNKIFRNHWINIYRVQLVNFWRQLNSRWPS